MRFNVGYQQTADNAFTGEILRLREHVAEVYFPWPDIASGRGMSAATNGNDGSPFACQQQLIGDLEAFRRAGIALNLLLNGNCYGRDSQSRAFFRKIGDTVDYLVAEFDLASVTTSSPLIAKFLKQNFPGVERRASVNMEIGTREGIDYVAEYFDGYYLKRELNRNLAAIKEIKKYTEQCGKKLYCLVNSGCLNFCSAHNFHDNLVAHEHEIAAMDNAYEFTGACSAWLAKAGNREWFFSRTNFIRPEDLGLYEGLFAGYKLATRVSPQPGMILRAYAAGKFSGNIPDLLEPAHGRHFHPAIIANDRLPEDFGSRVSGCGKNCAECGYCRRALSQVLVQCN